ncbi:MAG TPA: signal peptidase II [Ilumatobacteraceae bacterium]|nr:signal peptidase II [Ilumatobacteraceae bacterium]
MTGPPSNPRGSASAPTPKRVGSPDRRRDRTVLAFTALAVLVVDVTSKVAASTWLRDAPVELPGPLDLQLAYNPGAAFGLGSNLPLAVVLAVTTTVAALIAIGAWRGWLPNPWAAGLIVGGAIGNVIDRAEAGTVVDMLHTGWWPTFNLADVAIVCGAMLLAFSSLRSNEPDHQRGHGDPGDAA